VRSLLLAVLLILVAPGVAGAAVTPGDYGGGAVKGRGGPGHLRTGTVWMWARVGADGRARIGGRAKVACGLTYFDAQVALGPDGSFRFTRTRRTRERGHRLLAVVTVQGRFDGAAASGTVRGRLRNRLPSGAVRRCSTHGRRPWQLRLPAPPGPPAPPQPATTYLGVTGQPGDVPRPFLLRVSRNAARISTAIFEYTRRCRNGDFFLNDVTPPASIRPDGSFAIRERFTLRFSDATERFRINVDGRFTAGGVTGGLRVTSVARRRGSGRVIDRCDTGQLTFNAQV
jgi:hypothetical protein